MIHMAPSSWLAAFLQQYERFRPTAYKPTQNDIWTVGYGHTAGVTSATICTMAQAHEWLEDDIAVRAAVPVNRLVNVALTQPQFDALCSLVFNTGPAPLTKTLGVKLNAKDYAGAAQEFLKWDYQAGVQLPGLENRRQAEMARFNAPA